MDQSNCLRVIGIDFYPYVIFLGPNFTFPVVGVMYDLLKTASKRLNFCYNLSYSLTNDYAIKLENGSFSGALGEVERGEAEFLLSPQGITIERMNAVEFTTFVDTVSHAAAYSYPRPTPDLLGFLRPFSWKVWLCILATIMILFLLFLITNLMKSSNTYITLISVVETFFSSFVPVLDQDVHNAKGVSEIILGFWLMVALTLGIIYKSNLKAMLTAPHIVVPFETFEEMLTQNVLPVNYHPYTVLQEELEKSDSASPLGRLYQKANPSYRPIEVSIEMVIRSKIAEITGISALNGIIHKDFSKVGHCRITIMKEDFLNIYMGLSFKKGSKLRKKFDSIIVSYRESGIWEHLKSKMMSNASKCSRRKGSGIQKLRQLSVKDFYGIFSLYFIGLVMAFGFFIIELSSRFRCFEKITVFCKQRTQLSIHSE